MPNCRISQYYYKRRETAQQALETDNFIPRYLSSEVEYCKWWFRLQIKGGKGIMTIQEIKDIMTEVFMRVDSDYLQADDEQFWETFNSTLMS